MRWIDNTEWRWLVASAARNNADSEGWLARNSRLQEVDRIAEDEAVVMRLRSKDGYERNVVCDRNENVMAVARGDFE